MKFSVLQNLTHSFKILQVTPVTTPHYLLRARNGIWLLINCSNLQQAVLSFAVDKNDTEFLKDHNEAFHKRSNVKAISSQDWFCLGRTGSKVLLGSSD